MLLRACVLTLLVLEIPGCASSGAPPCGPTNCASGQTCTAGVWSRGVSRQRGRHVQGPGLHRRWHQASRLILGDFNEDGLPDLLVIAGSFPWSAQVFLNTRSGGVPVDAIAVRDFNGDGHLDMGLAYGAQSSIIGNFTPSRTLYRGSGTGQSKGKCQ